VHLLKNHAKFKVALVLKYMLFPVYLLYERCVVQVSYELVGTWLVWVMDEIEARI
jgi:hypothetical protein